MVKDEILNERELIERSQNGDRDAFGGIMEYYLPKIYNFCYRITLNEAEAKDLCQETFIRGFEKIKLFNFKSSFTTWLYRVAINLWVSKKRKLANRISFSMDRNLLGDGKTDFTDTMSSFEKEPQKEMEENEMISILMEELSKLDEDEKAIIILKYIEGRSYKEISKICSCKSGTVGSRLYRAIEKLKEAMFAHKQRGLITETIMEKWQK